MVKVSGVPQDLTDWQVRASIGTSSRFIAELAVEFTDRAAGEFTLSAETATWPTGALSFDIRYTTDAEQILTTDPVRVFVAKRYNRMTITTEITVVSTAERITITTEGQLRGPAGRAGVQYNLSTWAYTQAFQAVTATRDANGAIVTAIIVWPDGVAGVFTTDVASTAFPGAIDAWHATYASTPSKTITQPAVTRDASGAVIAQPAITIS